MNIYLDNYSEVSLQTEFILVYCEIKYKPRESKYLSFGKLMSTQNKVCKMFDAKYPYCQISQSTVSRAERKFRKARHVIIII